MVDPIDRDCLLILEKGFKVSSLELLANSVSINEAGVLDAVNFTAVIESGVDGSHAPKRLGSWLCSLASSNWSRIV